MTRAPCVQPRHHQQHPASHPLVSQQGQHHKPYTVSDCRMTLSKGQRDGDYGADNCYSCGISLAWVNFQWSAAPGLPARTTAINWLRDMVSQKPWPAPVIDVGVPMGRAYEPHHHKGALRQVSPEGVPAAIVAIARDVRNQEDLDTMQKWSAYVRSAMCTSALLHADMDLYWYAIDQREQLELSRVQSGKKVDLSTAPEI